MDWVALKSLPFFLPYFLPNNYQVSPPCKDIHMCYFYFRQPHCNLTQETSPIYKWVKWGAKQLCGSTLALSHPVGIWRDGRGREEEERNGGRKRREEIWGHRAGEGEQQYCQLSLISAIPQSQCGLSHPPEMLSPKTDFMEIHCNRNSYN